jgi:hypothetical protein
MKAKDLICELQKLEPETEVKFFTFKEGSYGEYKLTQIFVQDISEVKDDLVVLLG